MRVSSNQYHITVNASLQNTNGALEKLMSQMASGNRLLRPSDDPISHVRVSRLQREESNIAQYLDNIGALSSRLSKSESMLSSVNSEFLNARDLMVWALDGGNAAKDLETMATSLESLRDSLYANTLTKDQEGNYLFSGTATKTPTVVLTAQDAQGNPVPAGQRYSAGGNEKQQMVVVGNGIEQAANVTMQEMAGWLNTLDVAIDALKQGNTSNDPAVRAPLQDALQMIDVAMDTVSTKIARLGGAQNIIASLDTNWRNLSVANQTAALDYAQLDYAEASTRLSSLLAAVQATQGAYGKVSQLSLFNVL